MDSTSIPFETIEMACAQTFGPRGVAALIQGPTGSMSITRRGWPLVQSIYAENNLRNLPVKLMLNNLKKVHSTLGDGVKSFLLVEIALLRCLMQVKKENKLPSTRVFQELQSLFQALCDMEVVCSRTFSFSIRADREKATTALFSASCPCNVSTFLQTVFHDWTSMSFNAMNHESGNENYVSHLEFLRNNFDLLCYKDNNSSRCVSDSFILSGYLVDRVALNMKNKEEGKVQVEIYIPPIDANNSEILSEIKFLIENVLAKRKLQTLLLTTAFLPEKAVFELKLKNIVVLHGVPVKDVELISFVLRKSSPNPNNTIGMKVFMSGNKECTCLMLHTIYQLIICAPTESLSFEYACVCKNALNYLLILARSNCREGLVKAGGNFEKSFYFHIAAHVNTLKNPSVFFIHNRNELLQWHLQNQLMKCDLSHTEVRHETSVRRVLVTDESTKLSKVSLNETESSCSSILQSPKCYGYDTAYNRSAHIKPNVSTVPDMLTDDLKINNLLFQNVDKNIIAAFSQSLLVVYNRLSLEFPVNEIYESVSFKIQLWQQIIAAAMQFFKYDATV